MIEFSKNGSIEFASIHQAKWMKEEKIDDVDDDEVIDTNPLLFYSVGLCCSCFISAYASTFRSLKGSAYISCRAKHIYGGIHSHWQEEQRNGSSSSSRNINKTKKGWKKMYYGKLKIMMEKQHKKQMKYPSCSTMKVICVL